jgi:hypothetical protein
VSTVFLDPTQMDATASAISVHAAEVEAVARDLQVVGAAEVPPVLGGWLESELADIATTIQMAAVLYLVAAMDTILRAESIRTNQSLANAIPPVDAPAAAFSASGFVVGNPGGSSYSPPATPAAGFVLDVDPVFTPSGNGYLLNNVPIYHPVTPGTYSGGAAASGGSRLVEEQTMTLRLIGMEAISGANANRSMSRY